MKLNVPRDALLKPLQLVSGVVERKHTMSILANVLLKIENNMLSITATDSEIQLIGQSRLIDCSDNKGLTLPARKLLDICKSLPENASIELYQEQERIVLRSGRSRFTLSTLPASEFPNIEEQRSNIQFIVPQQDLAYLLHRCHFSMAQQDVRYYLNGLLLDINSNKLRAVATDGHRLSTTVLETSTGVDHSTQVIIPRKGALELLRILTSTNEPVTVTIANSYIRIATDHCLFTSKLIDGQFPDYQKVIPGQSNKVLIIDRDELKQALTRAAILCNEKFRSLRLELRHNLIRISANNPEQEAAEEEIAINYSGGELDMGFNVNYLLDVLNTINSGDVKLSFSENNGSILIQEADNDGDSIFVVMPMRL